MRLVLWLRRLRPNARRRFVTLNGLLWSRRVSNEQPSSKCIRSHLFPEPVVFHFYKGHRAYICIRTRACVCACVHALQEPSVDRSQFVPRSCCPLLGNALARMRKAIQPINSLLSYSELDLVCIYFTGFYSNRPPPVRVRDARHVFLFACIVSGSPATVGRVQTRMFRGGKRPSCLTYQLLGQQSLNPLSHTLNPNSYTMR
jgi:hypothetical protein